MGDIYPADENGNSSRLRDTAATFPFCNGFLGFC